MGAVPAETVTAVIARSQRPEPIGTRWLPWWLAQRDTAALGRALKQAEGLARRSGSGAGQVRARSWRSAAAAYLALARGDSASAVRDLEAMPDSFCGCAMQKLTLAQLLAARGDDRTAGGVLDRWVWSLSGPFFVIGRMERARIAERLGDHD